MNAGSDGATHSSVLTDARVFGAPDLSGPDVRGAAFSPDGAWITFLKFAEDEQGRLDLWIMPASGARPARRLADSRTLTDGLALTEAEIARRERQRISEHGIVEYRWDPSGGRILAPVNGALFLLDLISGEARRRIGRDGPDDDVTDARFSPKGTWISFVRQRALWIAPTEAGDAVRISPEASDAVAYGVAEFVAQEEFARDTGYWWSPDETRIAYTQTDESGVSIASRVDFGAAGVSVATQRFPYAGEANAVVDLYIQAVASGERIQVDLGEEPDIYLARVTWDRAGERLYVQRQSRDQRVLDLIGADPRTGRTSLLVRERQEPWINLNLDFTPLSDGGFLWVSERTGFNHIYLYDRNGGLVRQVTEGPWTLASRDRNAGIAGVDEAAGLVFFLAWTDSPLERHLFGADYRTGGPPRRLTQGAGQWTVKMSPSSDSFIGRFSDPETPPNAGVYDLQGRRRAWICENPLDESHLYFPYRAGLPRPEFGTLEAEDGQALHYVLLKPAGFDPRRRYPVIVQVYGGPGRQHVTRSWRSPVERLFLDAGYVFFQLDNRGSENRGLAFEAPIHQKLGFPETRDQIRGLDFLRSLPFVDPDRLGMMGWSYGGFMTLRMLTEPGAGLAAGIAGAAPGAWGMYDTHYTERFMGRPQDAPEAYEACSLLPRLKNLDGRLMLIHGMADDNVLFENATRMMGELQQRAIPFELMLYPGQRHGILGSNIRLHLYRTQLAFFDRCLRPETAVPVVRG